MIELAGTPGGAADVPGVPNAPPTAVGEPAGIRAPPANGSFSRVIDCSMLANANYAPRAAL